MHPLVTIGIPCFNGATWLKQAIDSALSQTWGEVEVIVADDGSTDSSVLIAGAYGDRVHLRRAGHRGANAARNLILKEAHGEWIQYLDADDFLEPQKVERQLAEADGGDNADVIYSPVWIEEGGTRRMSELNPGLDLAGQWLAWQLPQTGEPCGGAMLWRNLAAGSVSCRAARSTNFTCAPFKRVSAFSTRRRRGRFIASGLMRHYAERTRVSSSTRAPGLSMRRVNGCGRKSFGQRSIGRLRGGVALKWRAPWRSQI